MMKAIGVTTCGGPEVLLVISATSEQVLRRRVSSNADYRKVWPFPTESLATYNDATDLPCCVNSIQGLDTTPA